MKKSAILGTTAMMLAIVSAPAQAQFQSALDQSTATANESKASQQRIDQLEDQTAALLNDYRAQLKQLEAARRYNESLGRNITSQERSIERLREDIDNVAGLQKAMLPLMEDMVERFSELINADVPFNEVERQARADRLVALLDNPSQTAAQKYRLIVEAYQIENEQGRTIGNYEGDLVLDSGTLTGEFLRIGRVALIFKTPDDSTLKIWDKDASGWVDLANSYLPDVKYALRMAKEQTAPDIFFIPVKPAAAAQ